MRRTVFLTLILILLGVVNGFVARSAHVSTRSFVTSLSSGTEGSNEKNGDTPFPLALDKAMDVSIVKSNMGSIRENLFDGELGERGELYVAGQLGLMAFIAIGGVPFLGGIITAICGPGFLLVGLLIIWLGIQELGPALSPWPTTNDRTSLVTSGVYSFVRHPMYTGLLMACGGLSIVTGSAFRFLLTVALWKVLDSKSDYEEERMREKYPKDYPDYQLAVEGKFFPSQLGLNLTPLKEELLDKDP